MKGNQEPMLYATNAAVASLNHVSGFDPLKFLRRTTSRKTGEDVMRLDLRYKKLWFRLACPTGRLKLNALRITEKMAIFEAKVYSDREDAEPLSSYVANCTLDATPGGLYVEAAQEEALDTALSNAGFGIQFSEPGEEQDRSLVDAPVTIPDNGLSEEMVQDESEEELLDEMPQAAEMQKKASEQKKAEWDASMPVEELMQKMSLEDAKNYLIPIGAYKGKTLGELCVEKPGAINWYVESYHGKNNVLRAGAKLLLAAVEK